MIKKFSSRKKIRLDSSLYSNPTLISSVTIGTQRSIPIFQRIKFGQACLKTLIKHAEKFTVPIFAYCFMPDHVHLLLSASKSRSIPSFVSGFKSLCTRIGRFNFGIDESFWQKRYYDHFLRQEEDIMVVVNYILNNPVRKGLVNNWREYPLCGSLVYDL